MTLSSLLSSFRARFAPLRAPASPSSNQSSGKKSNASKRPTVLRLSVPKHFERSPVGFEQVLASLHGLLSSSTTRVDTPEAVSFEIAKIRGKIYFYVVVPSHLRTLIRSQFYAQYPEVHIEEVPEYFTRSLIKDKEILIADLAPVAPSIFPIKRHPQFQDGKTFEDPIGPITAAVSHLHSRTDNVIIQYVVAPIGTDWNEVAQQNSKRFFGSGAWGWSWFSAAFYRNRLAHTKKERTRNALVWGPMLALAGWAKNPTLQAPEGGDEGDDLDSQAKMSGSHSQETVYGAVYDKLSRLHFEVNIRAAYIHSDPDPLHAEAKIREILGTFQQFSMPQMNAFSIRQLDRSGESPMFKQLLRRQLVSPFALSQEELATVYHLPTVTVQTPAIQWVESPKLEPPVDLPLNDEEDATLIGSTNFRGMSDQYGIRQVDRRRHVYIIGKTGMGKSTLLENMIFSDIQKGRGVGVIDPHGDLADAVLEFVPRHRTNDVILFEPADTGFPLAFNMLEGKNQQQRGLIASGLVGVIKKLNINSWGPRLEHFLRNTILALVEAPDTTMLGIVRMLVDPLYRKKILNYVQDPMVKSFWDTEFAALDPRRRAEAIGPIQNKIGQFLATPLIRNIVGQPKSTLDIRFAMDSGKIVIVNLSKGKIGEDNSSMLGSLLITKFQLDAMSRADMSKDERRDFYLYVDEFQNFATDSFATILSEARKYKLNLTMANQYVAQMNEEVAAAVFGNVGSLISFQIGIDDAQVFANQFDEDRITPIALASLPKYQVYNRIMVDGMTTPVFSANTLPPPELNSDENPAVRAEKIRNFSRQRYAKPREEVEERINRWSMPENTKRKKNDANNKNSKDGGSKKDATKGNATEKPLAKPTKPTLKPNNERPPLKPTRPSRSTTSNPRNTTPKTAPTTSTKPQNTASVTPPTTPQTPTQKKTPTLTQNSKPAPKPRPRKKVQAPTMPSHLAQNLKSKKESPPKTTDTPS